MKAFLNSFMSWLGYVPRSATSVSTIKIDLDIDCTSVDAALVKVERLAAAAEKAEVAVLHAGIIDPGPLRFVTSDLVADETSPLILAELRKQTTLLEVLAKQGDKSIRDTISTAGTWVCGPATDADASGFPG